MITKQQARKPDLSRQLEVLCDFLEAKEAPTIVFEALEAIEEMLLSERIMVWSGDTEERFSSVGSD